MALGTFTVPMTVFGLTRSTSINGALGLRSGLIGQAEFESAIRSATNSKTTLILHPSSIVNITKNCLVTCSITGAGSQINVANEADLIFSGKESLYQKVRGLRINGRVSFEHKGNLEIVKNDFSLSPNYSLKINSESMVIFKKNIIKSENAHALTIINNKKGLFENNEILVKGSGQFVWAEDSFEMKIHNNSFRSLSKGFHPSIAISNKDDVNPSLSLHANKLI